MTDDDRAEWRRLLEMDELRETLPHRYCRPAPPASPMVSPEEEDDAIAGSRDVAKMRRTRPHKALCYTLDGQLDCVCKRQERWH